MKRNRFLIGLLAVCMLFSLLPFAARAENSMQPAVIQDGSQLASEDGWFSVCPASEDRYYFSLTGGVSRLPDVRLYRVTQDVSGLTEPEITYLKAKLTADAYAERLAEGRAEVEAGRRALDESKEKLAKGKAEHEAARPAVEQYRQNRDQIVNILNQYQVIQGGGRVPFGYVSLDDWYRRYAKPLLNRLGLDAPDDAEELDYAIDSAEWQMQLFDAAELEIAAAEQKVAEGERLIARADHQLAEMEAEVDAYNAALQTAQDALQEPYPSTGGFQLTAQGVSTALGCPLEAEQVYWYFSAPQTLPVQMRVTSTTAPESKNPFRDVEKGTFYYDPVLWAVNHNPQITNGTGANTFSPDAACTRGQVVTFLWRAMGCPEPSNPANPFTDVSNGAYYYQAVLWANEKGITNGTSQTTFSPESPCTRAHVVTFLWRAHQMPAAGSSNPFADVFAGQYYTDAVLWAVSKNITNGIDATHFGPDDPCTRGQIVTFLYRDLKQ